jgi:hypothetical protein
VGLEYLPGTSGNLAFKRADDEADKLIQNGISYHKQRAELLAKTYEQVKQALGGITAARFAMVEQQLLTLIDLEVLSALPVAEPVS